MEEGLHRLVPELKKHVRKRTNNTWQHVKAAAARPLFAVAALVLLS